MANGLISFTGSFSGSMEAFGSNKKAVDPVPVSGYKVIKLQGFKGL
jgi:hypothetical protein